MFYETLDMNIYICYEIIEFWKNVFINIKYVLKYYLY
jgi:hypothetical protein